MKLLLVQPAKAPDTIGGEEFFILEPLALEYIAAGVINDHEVKKTQFKFCHFFCVDTTFGYRFI